jgi:hypothetical protein
MRKDRVFILILSLLALAAPCFAQAAPDKQPNNIKPPQAKTTGGSPKKSAARSMSSSADDPVAKERQLLEALKKGDIQGFGSFLTDDAMELTDHGLNTKAQILEVLKGASLIDYTMTEVKMTAIDKDATLVTYRTSGKFSANGQEGTYDSRASTVWVKRGGKWLAFFHQEMPVGQPHQ